MIKRAPRPDHGFLIIRNDVVRDRRLSYLARGVLASILSRPDNWTVSAERLAAETDADEGTKTVRRALRELEAAGYLERRRVRAEKGRFVWEQVIFDAPRTVTKSEQKDVSAGRTISPSPPDGYPPDGEGTSKEEPRRSTEEEDVPDLLCPTAFGGGDDENSDLADDPWADPWAAVDEKSNSSDEVEHADWRAQDRELFHDILRHRQFRSEGYTGWRAGTFPINSMYKGLRTKGKKWPGLFLEKINREHSGLDSWLDNQGFELLDQRP